ncbi:hypothetical protein V1478_013384 [Vespula squamosa]|uniref:Uncharacterized protein n=1 Tax=Vespula squamosa TaxID=30214 RepID=A0ABD2AAQ3_VESSQ
MRRCGLGDVSMTMAMAMAMVIVKGHITQTKIDVARRIGSSKVPDARKTTHIDDRPTSRASTALTRSKNILNYRDKSETRKDGVLVGGLLMEFVLLEIKMIVGVHVTDLELYGRSKKY